MDIIAKKKSADAGEWKEVSGNKHFIKKTGDGDRKGAACGSKLNKGARSPGYYSDLSEDEDEGGYGAGVSFEIGGKKLIPSIRSKTDLGQEKAKEQERRNEEWFNSVTLKLAADGNHMQPSSLDGSGGGSIATKKRGSGITSNTGSRGEDGGTKCHTREHQVDGPLKGRGGHGDDTHNDGCDTNMGDGNKESITDDKFVVDGEENPDVQCSKLESSLVSSTFLATLRNTVRSKDSKTFVTWYDDGGKATEKYTFGELWEESGVVAYHLRMKWNLEKGDRVVLCYGFGIQFFSAFLGCLRAGLTAVLVYPPSKPLSKSLPKMKKVVDDCNAKLILTDFKVNLLRKADQANPISKSRHLWPKDVNIKVHVGLSNSKTSNLPFRREQKELVFDDETQTLSDVAFLQYTSGSTGSPKGVIVTYGALNANVDAMKTDLEKLFANCGKSPSDIVGLSWLPQYHDMGLIFAIIAPFSAGWTCNMMSPLSFIRNPELWIDLMSRLRVSWSVAPDFAYRLAARKFKANPSNLDKDLDLSSIVTLMSAAEPIRPGTVSMFGETFQQYGLKDDWFCAAYGLAETVVYASHMPTLQLSKPRPETGASLVAVSHRRVFPESQITKIVNPTTFEEVNDGSVGELWLSSPSVAAGYFGKAELTEEVFHAKIVGSDERFLRTGDLAFLEDDCLYICGRSKDLIIVNGVNYYPQDIEHVVQDASPSVRPGCIAAFSSDDAGGDGDLEVIFEIRSSSTGDAESVVNAVHMSIASQVGLVPTRVVAIKEKTVLKTTSGKIQRKANRTALHENKHTIVHEHRDPRASPAPGTTFDDSGLSSHPYGNEYDIEQGLQCADAKFDNIIKSFFGRDFDSELDWDDLGLSSMASVQLRDAISESFAISLSADCFEAYTNPAQLRSYVRENQGKQLPIDLTALKENSSTHLSWVVMGVAQGMGSILLLFIFAFSVVPAWFIGTLSFENGSLPLQAFGTDATIYWSWLPFAVPVWMASYSSLVVMLKWTTVGKYTEGIIPVTSMAFLRWWLVDRAIDLWEFWVGRFILDTPLITLFYVAMGTSAKMSVAFRAFIREFDLVSIEEGTSIETSMNCRKFGTWDDTPLLRFRKTMIGRHCVVKGTVQLGSSVGAGAFIEKLSLIPEGAQVPAKTRVEGNPAHVAAEMFCNDESSANTAQSSTLGFLKVLWLGFELYLFFATMLLAQYLWVAQLPKAWRYTNVLKWLLLLLWFSVASILASVAMKWAMIGKRRPGPYVDSLLCKFRDWAVDWHFQTATGFLLSLSSHSRFWNFVLMMHGMDIDFKSRLAAAGGFLPSKVDLIEVKDSFVSAASFGNKRNGTLFKTTIKQSSVGLLAHVGPGRDLTIEKSVISPLFSVTKSISQKTPDCRMSELSMLGIAMDELKLFVGYVICLGLVFCTLLPSYELWVRVFNNPQSIWVAVPALVCALALQTLAWTIMLALIQSIALAFPKDGSPWSKTVYQLYGTMAFCHQRYSMISLLLGSPAYNCLVTILGVKIDGRALLMPQRMYEYSYLSFGDKTIIDSSQICGHYGVYNELTIGPCKVTGTMHTGSYAANADVASNESGPWRAFVGKSEVFRDV